MTTEPGDSVRVIAGPLIRAQVHRRRLWSSLLTHAHWSETRRTQ